MFRIVALAYVMVYGQPIDEPYVLENARSFPSIEACQEHLKSNEFEAQRAVLSHMLANALRKQFNANAEDGDAVPAVAITASCQTDNRI